MTWNHQFDTLRRWVWDKIIGAVKRLRWIPVAISLMLMPITQLAEAQSIEDDNVWLVDGNDGDDQNTGQEDWEEAFLTLQHALTVVEAGDLIWVAASEDPYVPSVGVDPNLLPFFAPEYTPDVEARMVYFELPKNVGIYGGFLGNAHPSGGETLLSQADPVNNVTTLSGYLGLDQQQNPVYAYHVLFYFQSALDNTPPNPAQMIVDGFTITASVADGGDDSGATSQGALNRLGGGALIVFEAHFEYYSGQPGDADPDFAKPEGPVFSRCVFDSNFAELGGGALAGVYNGGRVVDCTLKNNEHTATTGSDFGGKTSRGGGAINVLGPVAILKSTFIENESVSSGGAVHHSGNVTEDDVIVVSNCEFRENTAPTGGDVSALPGPVVNCLFVGNSATGTDAEGGGAIAIAGGIHGSTFVANSADGLGGGASNGPPVSNNIFWKNTSGQQQPTPAWRAQVEMSDSLANDYNLIED